MQWPWQDSNLQSLVPKTNALSIRPQGQVKGDAMNKCPDMFVLVIVSGCEYLFVDPHAQAKTKNDIKWILMDMRHYEGQKPPLGIEPRTFSLQDWRSTTEL